MEDRRPLNLAESSYIHLLDIKQGLELKMILFNAKSINNEFHKIRDAVHSGQTAIIYIQETWSKNEMTNYFIKGYHKPEIRGEIWQHDLGRQSGIWIHDDVDFETIKGKAFLCLLRAKGGPPALQQLARHFPHQYPSPGPVYHL